MAFDDWAETFEKAQKGKKVEKQRGVYFTSLEAMRKVLTEKRLQLLRAIKERQPASTLSSFACVCYLPP